jgi:hypothetical protein
VDLTIANDGPQIIATNYWTSAWAHRGALYLSINAGAIRLLMPRGMEGMLDEMRTARECLLSRGPWTQARQGVGGDAREAYELLYEDGSNSPYVLHLGAEQADRLLPASESGRTIVHTVWTRGFRDAPVCALTLPARYRVVRHLPYLKPWGK